MKLEVGMYVRTDTGIIEKINQIYDRHATDNIVVWLNGFGDGRSVFVDDFEEVKYQSINARGFIKKEPSYRIIDLIEVGDYVNGLQVYETGIFGHNGKTFCRLYGNVAPFYNEDIKSIVTKEQFQKMEYRIGE